MIDVIEGNRFDLALVLVCKCSGGQEPEFVRVPRYYAPNLGRSIWQHPKPDAVWGIRVAPGKWLIRGLKFRSILVLERRDVEAHVLEWGYWGEAARKAAKAMARAITEEWGEVKCLVSE